MNCPKCNFKLKENNDYCIHCGYIIKSNDNLKDKNNINILMIISFILGILSLIFVYFNINIYLYTSIIGLICGLISKDKKVLSIIINSLVIIYVVISIPLVKDFINNKISNLKQDNIVKTNKEENKVTNTVRVESATNIYNGLKNTYMTLSMNNIDITLLSIINNICVENIASKIIYEDTIIIKSNDGVTCNIEINSENKLTIECGEYLELKVIN